MRKKAVLKTVKIFRAGRRPRKPHFGNLTRLQGALGIFFIVDRNRVIMTELAERLNSAESRLGGDDKHQLFAFTRGRMLKVDIQKIVLSVDCQNAAA